MIKLYITHFCLNILYLWKMYRATCYLMDYVFTFTRKDCIFHAHLRLSNVSLKRTCYHLGLDKLLLSFSYSCLKLFPIRITHTLLHWLRTQLGEKGTWIFKDEQLHFGYPLSRRVVKRKKCWSLTAKQNILTLRLRRAMAISDLNVTLSIILISGCIS